jgi:hypothetical protein
LPRYPGPYGLFVIRWWLNILSQGGLLTLCSNFWPFCSSGICFVGSGTGNGWTACWRIFYWRHANYLRSPVVQLLYTFRLSFTSGWACLCCGLSEPVCLLCFVWAIELCMDMVALFIKRGESLFRLLGTSMWWNPIRFGAVIRLCMCTYMLELGSESDHRKRLVWSLGPDWKRKKRKSGRCSLRAKSFFFKTRRAKSFWKRKKRKSG